MQSAVIETDVQYATLKINATTVGIWGHCHKRIGNNYLLRMRYGTIKFCQHISNKL